MTTMAVFQTNLSGLTQHADLLLEWDPVDATDYPLAIHLRVFNATSEHKVNTFEADITSK